MDDTFHHIILLEDIAKNLKRIADAQEALASYAAEVQKEKAVFKEAREKMAKDIHEMLLKPPLEEK